jgi:hypothetical protein
MNKYIQNKFKHSFSQKTIVDDVMYVLPKSGIILKSYQLDITFKKDEEDEKEKKDEEKKEDEEKKNNEDRTIEQMYLDGLDGN